MALLAGCVTAPAGTAAHAPAKEAAAMVLGEQDDGRHVAARVGDVLELRLPENASTGYRWTPEAYDHDRLQLAEETASYPKAAVGSGGMAIFRFRVTGAGSSTLGLKYQRSWETPDQALKRFSVTLDAAR